jgi:hypothetical protein
MSPEGFVWANSIIKQYPKLPVILTTHEVAGPTYDDSVYPYQSGDDEDNASLSAYGQQLWDGLINDNDQIFLTLNGHYWPPGRTVLANAAGNDVHVHITNYQNRYFGGAAMIRLYHFDLELNTIEVETIAPYFLEQPAEERNLLAAQLAELTTTVDRFSVPVDFAQRFSGFDPIPVRPARPAKEMLVPGTLAYWRFDAGGASGSSFTSAQTVPDLSGHGNDLSVLVTVPGSPASSLSWSSEFHPDQPGHGSLYFDGQQSPSLVGAYLTTASGARLNTETFAGGYTFEVFVQVPTDWNSNSLPWALGGYEYGGTINQIWHGWIGDVRIVNRPLSVGEFMIAGR